MLKSNSTAIVLCGHGSSFNLYEQDFKKNHRMIEEKIRTSCYFCFIEKSQPSIENCMKALKKKDVKKIFFFPFLLFNGEHFEKDIKAKIKVLSNTLKLDIKLIDKISLTGEVMPIVKKKVSRILKKNKKNILVTFCSRSKNPKVNSELKTYTQALVKNLDISDAYSYFIGEETEFLKKIKNFEDGNYFLIVHPVFLFKGYLQNKNLDFFKNINSKNHHILNTLMAINDIQILIVKKLKGIFHITD
tara:strand:+ start:692 stop:1426 length:735 start_codon:yes stop_codon:yes gene_type:complete